MVQILPQEPGIGELLGGGLGTGLQTGLSSLMEVFMKEKSQERQMKRISEMLGQQKPSGYQDTQRQGQPTQEQPTGQFVPPYNEEKAMALAMHPNKNFQDAGKVMLEKNKSAFDQWKFGQSQEIKKQQVELQREERLGVIEPGEAHSMLESIGEMEKMIPYVGTKYWGAKTFGGDWFRRKTLEKRNEFNSMVSQFVGYVRKMESRGNLPRDIFKDLLKRVPDAELSERENKGRLNAFKKRIERELKIRERLLGKQEQPLQQNEFQMGQSFESLPKSAPENAVMRKGNQRYIFKNGKWSKL